jgi:predicted ester cyclase
MSLTPDAIARRWFKEVWNEGNESAIDRLMHPEALAHGLAGEAIRGPEGFKGLFRTFQSAIGDLRIEVERTVVEGDTCAALCHVTGKHVGHTLGGAPSGNAVDFYGMTIFRTQGDQLIEAWNCFDFLGMYQQIGWVKQPVVA